MHIQSYTISRIYIFFFVYILMYKVIISRLQFSYFWSEFFFKRLESFSGEYIEKPINFNPALL